VTKGLEVKKVVGIAHLIAPNVPAYARVGFEIEVLDQPPRFPSHPGVMEGHADYLKQAHQGGYAVLLIDAAIGTVRIYFTSVETSGDDGFATFIVDGPLLVDCIPVPPPDLVSKISAGLSVASKIRSM
jgi:hypothetical protein